MSYTLKEFEEYLKRINPGKYDKNESNIYPAVGKAASSKLSSAAPKVPTQSDTFGSGNTANSENTFYTGNPNSGIMGQNSGFFGLGQSANGATDNNLNGNATQNGGNGNQTGIVDSGQTTVGAGKAKGSIFAQNTAPLTDEQETQAEINKLETQMHNYLAANGGYVTTDNLPVLSGFQEKIAALQATLNQPEPEQETGKYATLGDAYADSLANGETFGLGFTDDVVGREQEIADQAKPSVPTMTGPIPEFSQPEEPMVPTMTEPIPEFSQPEETGETSIYDGDGRRRWETNQPAVPSGGDNGAGEQPQDDSQVAEYNSQIEKLMNRIDLIYGSMDNSYGLMNHGGLSYDEYTWHQNNYNNGFDQIDLIKEEIKEIEKETDRLNHVPTIAQKIDETEDMINKRREEGKPLYEAFNSTDVAIDEETINNIVIVGNNEYGAFSERYQQEYDAGNIEIRINDYNETKLSNDEAAELYFEEQAERNEAVSTMIGVLSAAEAGLTESIVWLGNELLQGDSITGEYIKTVIKGSSFEKGTKDGLTGFLIDKGTEAFLNTLDSMNYNINNIEGGNYIDVKIVQHSNNESAVPTLVQYLRLYEVDGTYIYDELNPLCYVISSPSNVYKGLI